MAEGHGEEGVPWVLTRAGAEALPLNPHAPPPVTQAHADKLASAGHTADAVDPGQAPGMPGGAALLW